MQEDVFGEAIHDYYVNGNKSAKISVHSADFDDDEIPVDYLFRSYEEMPLIEKTALQLAQGNILEVGCGVGSHALHLQSKMKKITAIDISPLSIEVAKMRGVHQAVCADFFDFESDQEFDTILMLMNGIGIAGKVNRLHVFFQQAKKLLSKKGQILLDSSDLIYLFEEDDVSNQPTYYGELSYQISYKNIMSEEFDWLYLDFESLKVLAQMNGFEASLIKKGSHYDYLAKLVIS